MENFQYLPVIPIEGKPGHIENVGQKRHDPKERAILSPNTLFLSQGPAIARAVHAQ
jgi:hypothetical protein